LRSGLRIGWPFALAILAGAVQLGCYKPNIKDGGLKCNLDAGVGKSCPEGFKCDMSRLTCWRNPDGGVDRPSDVVDGPVDGSMDMKSDVACFEVRPDCTPGPGMCDPACQTGCACGTKCSVNTLGALTCNTPHPLGFPRAVMQDCMEPISPGTAAQTDNCGPGLVCVDQGCAFPRCFQFCKNDGDCPTSACSRDLGTTAPSTQKVCEVPFADTCVPLPQNSGCGPASSGMACYLSSTNPSHTICDCPFNALMANQPCMRSRDCVRGLVCVDKGNGATPTCLQVCKLSNNGSDCPSVTPGSCHPYTGIPGGQAPHPTYGYCL